MIMSSHTLSDRYFFYRIIPILRRQFDFSNTYYCSLRTIEATLLSISKVANLKTNQQLGAHFDIIQYQLVQAVSPYALGALKIKPYTL